MSETPEENAEIVAEEIVTEEIVTEDAVVEVVTEVVVTETVAVDEDTPVDDSVVVDEGVLAAAPVEPAPGNADALGRRKEAVARVRLRPGTGEYKVNGRTLGEYFPDKVHQQSINSPFEVVGQLGKYDVTARITGGGISGQAGALRLAIARALNEIDLDAFRADLKAAGYLSRDSRAKERKKAGLKKARKAPQYSKR